MVWCRTEAPRPLEGLWRLLHPASANPAYPVPRDKHIHVRYLLAQRLPPFPLVGLSSSSSTFTRWSITTPLSFTSNRGPSSGSKPSPTRTTISSPTHASGIGLSATRLLPKLLSPRIPPYSPPCCPLERLSAPLVAGPMQGSRPVGPGAIGPGLNTGFREDLYSAAR